MSDSPEVEESVAPKLLSLLEGFFEEEGRKGFEAFKKLPLNPKQDDVNALKAYAHALDKLRISLTTYVENNYLTQLMGDRVTTDKGIDI